MYVIANDDMTFTIKLVPIASWIENLSTILTSGTNIITPEAPVIPVTIPVIAPIIIMAVIKLIFIDVPHSLLQFLIQPMFFLTLKKPASSYKL